MKKYRFFEKFIATLKSTDKYLTKNHHYDKINGRNFDKCNDTIQSTGLVLINKTLG
jgi:hypothetical protein